MNRASISAFIICHNEERRIERCLESVKWCDEIVVVDDGSTDRTLEICRRYTDKIFINPWPGYVRQKRFALEKCASDWVLNLDADEEVSPQLRQQIESALAGDNGTIDGYLLSRVVFYLGKFWRKGGWYPEYRLRVCRRSRTTWGGEDPHEKAIVEGPVQKLHGELFHYTHRDITDQARSMNNLTTISARTLYERGKRANVFQIALHPIIRFLKFYFAKRGFLEGFDGFVMGIMEGYAVFLKYVKLWELRRHDSERTAK